MRDSAQLAGRAGTLAAWGRQTATARPEDVLIVW